MPLDPVRNSAILYVLVGWPPFAWRFALVRRFWRIRWAISNGVDRVLLFD